MEAPFLPSSLAVQRKFPHASSYLVSPFTRETLSNPSSKLISFHMHSMKECGNEIASFSSSMVKHKNTCGTQSVDFYMFAQWSIFFDKFTRTIRIQTLFLGIARRPSGKIWQPTTWLLSVSSAAAEVCNAKCGGKSDCLLPEEVTTRISNHSHAHIW